MPRLLSLMVLLFFVSCIHDLYGQMRSLQLSLKDSRPIYYYSESSQTVVQEFTTGPDTIYQNMKLWYHFEFKGRTDTSLTLGLVYDTMHFVMQTPLYSYDSAIDSVSPPDSRAAGYQSILGIQLFLTLSHQGEILQIEGLKKARDVIVQNLSKKQDLSNIDITNIPILNEKELITGLSQLFIPFPEKPVKINDSWSRTSTFKGDFDLTYEDQITLAELKDSLNILRVESLIYTPERGFFTSKNGLEIRLKLKGEQSGTLKLDIDNGFVKSLELSQTILGTGDTIVDSQQMDWPISQTGTIKIIQKKPQKSE